MREPLWVDNLDYLSESLQAQLGRIRAGTTHPTIKGGSLEAVVRRTLRDYLPGSFGVAAGQVANSDHNISPQLDVMVYDHMAFPHLAVNEDASVVVCCEALFATVECKTTWDRGRVDDHFQEFSATESARGAEYKDSFNAAGYYVLVFDQTGLASPVFTGLADESRFVGVYTIAGRKAWTSCQGMAEFIGRHGNALSLLVGDLLEDCMGKGPKDVGDFSKALATLKRYLG